MTDGWFKIPGIQNGKYNLKDRLYSLDVPVRKAAKDAHILDIGCAEGLMSKWLIDNWKAASVHGLEVHEPYIESARSIMRGYDAEFFLCDLDFFPAWLDLHREKLRPQYDIVIALRVVQKLARPVEFLQALAPFIGKMFVLQVPVNAKGELQDVRSNNRRVRLHDVMGPGFKLVSQSVRLAPGGGDEFTGIYERVTA